MWSRKRAYTLIELLVVIAIIAILAAILFPVFASALFPVFASARDAAKKTQALSNSKQTGTSIVQYCVDNNDMYPFSHRMNPGQFPNMETPAGWTSVAREKEDALTWANSTQPYSKNYDIHTGPGVTYTLMTPYGWSSPNLPTRRKEPKNGTQSMNGLLHSYFQSAVARPSQLTLVWWGNMREELVGYTFGNPILGCGTDPWNPYGLAQDCRFNPAGRPSQYMVTSANATGVQNDVSWPPLNPRNDTAWVQGKGMCFVYADSSAKWVAMNAGGTAVTNLKNYRDPTMNYGTKGQQLRYHRCSTSPGSVNGYYLSFFRPDSEFTYPVGNLNTTVCGW